MTTDRRQHPSTTFLHFTRPGRIYKELTSLAVVSGRRSAVTKPKVRVANKTRPKRRKRLRQ